MIIKTITFDFRISSEFIGWLYNFVLSIIVSNCSSSTEKATGYRKLILKADRQDIRKLEYKGKYIYFPLLGMLYI